MTTQAPDLFDYEWLEDSKTGQFSRVAIGNEDSTWRCNTCGQGEADPYEYGCDNCGAEADAY
ncbi:hypothetical protein [Candidatus Methylobacter favarea]|uniref:hypothetical protein n=1 Tax=Candidatus Methylobacter favarea TaxID=2707345 RepID=UPI00157D50A7|nr:hypothetical protein [Candidatus Methylobacter favarea]